MGKAFTGGEVEDAAEGEACDGGGVEGGITTARVDDGDGGAFAPRFGGGGRLGDSDFVLAAIFWEPAWGGVWRDNEDAATEFLNRLGCEVESGLGVFWGRGLSELVQVKDA